MNKSLFYENALIAVIGIIGLGGIGLGLYLLKSIAILSFIILLLSFMLAFLLLKTFPDTKNFKGQKDMVLFLLGVALVCGGFVFFGNNKGRVIIENVFIDGKITHKPHYIENDEGGGGHYKTYYILKPTNSNNQTVIEIIDWIIILLCGLVIYGVFKINNKIIDLYRVRRFKQDNPKWQGEITEYHLEKYKDKPNLLSRPGLHCRALVCKCETLALKETFVYLLVIGHSNEVSHNYNNSFFSSL
jgi:hypothetical protein